MLFITKVDLSVISAVAKLQHHIVVTVVVLHLIMLAISLYLGRNNVVTEVYL